MSSFDFIPNKVHNVEELNKESWTNLVLPVFTFMRWVNVFSGQLTRDSSGTVIFKRGFIVRRCFVILIHIGTLVHVVGMSLLKEESMKGSMKILYRAVTLAYLFYAVAQFYCLNSSNSNKFQDVFLQISQLEKDLVDCGAITLPRKNKAKLAAWTLLVSCSIFSFCFSTIAPLNGLNLFFNGYESWAHDVMNYARTEAELLFGVNVTVDHSTYTAWVIQAAIVVPYAYFSVLFDIYWGVGFLLGLLWAFVFIKIIRSYCAAFLAHDKFRYSTSEVLRKFNEITSVLDGFNDTFSPLLLGAIVSGGSHFSVFIMTIFQGQTNRLEAGLNFVGFFIYWSFLFLAAEVNSSAHAIVNVLKRKLYTRPHEKSEHAQEMILLSLDLATNNIGFKGLGFFTVTYALIGTVLSLIITYAIVATQISTV